MNNFLITLPFVLVGLILLWFLLKRPQKRESFVKALPTDRKVKTPKGTTVYYDVDKPTTQKLEAIDRGLDTLFDIASRVYGYKNFSTHRSYHVWLAPKSDRCETPGFLVRDDSQKPYPLGWDGSVYDKDPRPGKTELCVAGFMLLLNRMPGMVVVDDLTVLESAVRNEGEHNLLYEVDIRKFAETQFVHDHPILPDVGESSVVSTCLGII